MDQPVVAQYLRDQQDHPQLTHLQVHHLQAVSIHQALVQQQIRLEQWEAFLKVVLWTR